MRIGTHPNNLHLTLAARWPGAFADLGARFVFYPEGRDTAALLARGEIDAGGTGSTPPILAAEAGHAVAYLAASAPRPANGAILTRANGPVRDVADLKGRAVALVDGSFLTFLLARSLEGAGLGLGDVIRRDLSPDASRQALASGEVAAWVAMAPHLEEALGDGQHRMLGPRGSGIANRSLFWTLKGRELDGEERAAFLHGLQRLGEAIAADPRRAAAYLSEGKGEAERRAWTRVVAGRDWRIERPSAAIHAEQNEEADTLLRHGVLSAPVRIARTGEGAG
ncbi:ABC transporter substrate-binding protein [Aureimonas psammosilenae]|uniref:ABC transporter substrate-binding protein n=1 Tax=Aureimonas psammosilenae TaxID=2495496 RepID=UPI001260900E|nr:ABC transporter substrate-binding protein [Aureimonas psammosilenae]